MEILAQQAKLLPVSTGFFSFLCANSSCAAITRRNTRKEAVHFGMLFSVLPEVEPQLTSESCAPIAGSALVMATV
jgi:hypothetical protein